MAVIVTMKEKVSVAEIAVVEEKVKENASATEIMAAEKKRNEIETAIATGIETGIVTEIKTVIMSENGKRTVAAEDLKPDHSVRLAIIISDAGNKKIIRNRSSKYKTLSCDWMKERKTVGVQCLPFYFCAGILIV